MRSLENSSTAEKIGGRKLRNDIIFILAVLLIIALIGICYLYFRIEGDLIRVTVDGDTFATYSLSEDIEVEIRTEQGSNILVIKEGKAYVREASCPDGICSAHRPISREGESIVCLPNKVVITVISKNNEAPDVSV